jgi:hypothetical protein
MKKAAVALFVSLPIAATAVEAPLAFTDAKISGPQFSIVDHSLQKAPIFFNEFGSEGPLPTYGRAIVVSRMPVIAPKTNIDPKMVKAPNSSIDYKLSVVSPDVEQAK